jgi:CubicO group peptidase (beta-lactamase class C family)/D-alanyl-D-alanine dipeptidase
MQLGALRQLPRFAMRKFTELQKTSGLAAIVLLALLFLLHPNPSSFASDRQVGPDPRYVKVAERLQQFIFRQMSEKNLPAFSIALVDDQKIVWARGFGYADPERKVPATAETTYRVGSVSKLFTDIAVMQLVEEGKLSLDAPVTQYLPDFHPHNPFGTSITLRELMTHRSGLVREPPVGNYFDSTSPSLAATVESLDRTTLVYKPGTRTKYSNAAIAVVGYVLQLKTGKPFVPYVQRAVLGPMGLTHTSFVLISQLQAQLAKARMWTYDGLTIPTPDFALGIVPAGNLYSTVLDLARFIEVLFAGGHVKGELIIRPQTLQEMWEPQYAAAGAKSGYGLGFAVSELDGHRMVGHAGGIYGFATQLSALPDDKLGAVTVTTVDGANAVTQRVANTALRMMLDARSGKALPAIPETATVTESTASTLAGRYGTSSIAVDLIDAGRRDAASGGQAPSAASQDPGEFFLLPIAGGELVQLRQQGSDLITDGRLGFGTELTPIQNGIRVGDTSLQKVASPKPNSPPEQWSGLVGEYGWPYDELYVLERAGKLTALIEWFEYDPLEQLSRNDFAFPHSGLYDGEQAIFTRDAKGVATRVQIGGVVFPRFELGGTEGPFFHIKPIQPLATLRREALAAQPPKEIGDFRKPDLVDVTALDPKIKLDIRYATTNDFLSAPVYTEAEAFLQRPAAEALARVAHKLERQGYGLLIHDAYRPWYVTKIFWDATPPAKRIFVADPNQGSRHNRGCSVDLTLYDLSTGRQLPMTGHYDEMTERSYARYPGGTSLERWNRKLLRQAMESEGFTVYAFEWWHFDYKDWPHYPILNLKFEQLTPRSTSANAPRSR